MKSVERKIWCEKSSSYLCSPLKKRAIVLRLKMFITPKISEKFLKKNLVEIKRLLPLQPQSNGEAK